MLHLAVLQGHEHLVPCLLRLRQVKDASSRLPLHLAAALGLSDRVVERLAEPATTLDARCSNGWTPLHYAAYYDQPDTCKFLIALEADVGARDLLGRVAAQLREDSGAIAEVRRFSFASTRLATVFIDSIYFNGFSH